MAPVSKKIWLRRELDALPNGNAERYNRWKYEDCKTSDSGGDHHQACDQRANIWALPDTSKQNESCQQHDAAQSSEQNPVVLPCSQDTGLDEKRHPPTAKKESINSGNAMRNVRPENPCNCAVALNWSQQPPSTTYPASTQRAQSAGKGRIQSRTFPLNVIPSDRYTLKQRAQNQTLHACCHDRPDGKDHVPPAAVAFHLGTKLK